MSKMTFKMAASFDMTTIIDVELFKTQLDKMCKASQDPRFQELGGREKALTMLVVQAADRSVEEGIAEMLRTHLRVTLNEMLARELSCEDDSLTIKVSPAKVTCDGIQANPI